MLCVECAEDVARWYNVRLTCRLRPELSWRVTRRYREFDALACGLRAELPAYPVPELPPKLLPLFGGAAQLQRRAIGLQRFCQEVLASPALIGVPAVAEFFDLSFGLWCQRDEEASQAQSFVDPAQQLAAVRIQAHARRMRVQCALMTRWL